MKCFIDYRVSEYLLGAGPRTITVAHDREERGQSYDLHSWSHEAGRYRGAPELSQPEYASVQGERVLEAEAELSAALEGRESVVMLAPMGAHYTIAVKVWQAVAQWDLQTGENDLVHAVRYGTIGEDMEHTQTLANLQTHINLAAASDEFADDRIENIRGLNQYYRDIGAYGDISPEDGSTATFAPARPPARPVTRRRRSWEKGQVSSVFGSTTKCASASFCAKGTTIRLKLWTITEKGAAIRNVNGIEERQG